MHELLSSLMATTSNSTTVIVFMINISANENRAMFWLFNQSCIFFLQHCIAMLGVSKTKNTAPYQKDLAAVYPPWINATSWSRTWVIRLLEFSIE